MAIFGAGTFSHSGIKPFSRSLIQCVLMIRQALYTSSSQSSVREQGYSLCPRRFLLERTDKAVYCAGRYEVREE